MADDFCAALRIDCKVAFGVIASGSMRTSINAGAPGAQSALQCRPDCSVVSTSSPWAPNAVANAREVRIHQRRAIHPSRIVALLVHSDRAIHIVVDDDDERHSS